MLCCSWVFVGWAVGERVLAGQSQVCLRLLVLGMPIRYPDILYGGLYNCVMLSGPSFFHIIPHSCSI